jgi:hypothetical protein
LKYQEIHCTKIPNTIIAANPISKFSATL